MNNFQARFSREAWNDTHVSELQECKYVKFNGIFCATAPKIGPSKEDLEWLRWKLCNLIEVEDVLDLGCNIGLFRGLFTEDWNYVGLDQSANAIAIAKKKFPDDQFRCMDAQDLENEEFDLVFTRAVANHNLGQDKVELVQAIHRVLRPGGYYLCYEGDLLADDDNLPANRWSDKTTREYMEPLGFELLEHPTDHLYLFQKGSHIRSLSDASCNGNDC